MNKIRLMFWLCNLFLACNTAISINYRPAAYFSFLCCVAIFLVSIYIAIGRVRHLNGLRDGVVPVISGLGVILFWAPINIFALDVNLQYNSSIFNALSGLIFAGIICSAICIFLFRTR
jgi:hypothetical protein